MVFNTGAALLDAIVLAVVSEEKEGTYGYKITQEVRAVLDVSESTLYPVLRRLLKDGCLEVYDLSLLHILSFQQDLSMIWPSAAGRTVSARREQNINVRSAGIFPEARLLSHR